MAEDVETIQEKSSNTCCAALKKKHSKLLEKYSKLEELKNKFRDCTALIQKKYDDIERENDSLKKALEELKLQVNIWKDEKEKESGRCVDLEDEVSALKDEISSLKDEVQLLKQNDNSASQAADKQIQEHLNVAQKEIKQLKELLDKERAKAAMEKKNAELEKKKADEALKKVEMGKKNVSEAQKAANVERKKAEENRLLWEKLKVEFDSVKSMLALEKSKCEAADKKVEAEKQNVIRERKRADLAVAKSEEQCELAETNLNKATMEKDRADDLSQKLEEARNRVKKLEELQEHSCTGKLVEARAGESNTARLANLTSDVCMGMTQNDDRLSKWTEKMFLEKEDNVIREKKRADSEKKKAKKQREVAEAHKKTAMEQKHRADLLSKELESYKLRLEEEKEDNIIREKKRADSENKKAKKQKEVAEAHKKTAMEQKHRADQLSGELESYKLRLEELQKEMQVSVTCRKYADNTPLRNNDVISEIDTIKLLKKQLKLEKMLVKHAKKASKVEAVRNKMLHQEMFHLKQECLWFQQRLDMLDKIFLHGDEGIHKLGKIGNGISTRETLSSDGYNSQLISGIHSRLGPPYRGSSQKMLKSSAIYSSSASFSDRPLVGSQERGTFSVTTSAKLGEDVSNLKPNIPRLSDKMRIKRNECDAVTKVDNSIKSPIKDNANERKVGHSERKRILDTVESIGNLYSKGEKLQQRVSEKLSLLHGILNDQENEPEKEKLKDNSRSELVRPFKRRRTLRDGTVASHLLQGSEDPKSILDLNIDHSDACMCAYPPQSDEMKSDWCCKDGAIDISRSNWCIPCDFVEMATHDYMKLLDLDNADDENSFRRAMAMPLSPLLPQIELHGDEILELDNCEMLVHKSIQEKLPNVKDNLASVDFSKNMDIVSASDTQFQPIYISGGKLGTSEVSGSANEEISIPCERGNDCTHEGPLKYFVVPSDNKDSSSILRILQAIHSCMPQCSFHHTPKIFLQSVLHTLLKAEDLSMKEKVCVFVSLILHGVSEVGTKNLTNFLSDNFIHSLDSMTLHIRSALSDPFLRRIFMESCDLIELFAVIEDFLLQRKLLACGDVSAESKPSLSSRINLVLNGNSIVLSEVLASAHLLVAGGSLLASLCSAVDHIGLVCEMSCNIISMKKFDPAVMLAVLHAFARICGSKYFTLQQYSVLMTVVKSVVMFLEKQSLSTNSTTPLVIPKICLCSTNCPFSEGAVSMENVALLLLENLQKHGQSQTRSQDLELVNSQVPEVWSHGERTEEVSGLREAFPLRSPSDENLCNCIDILSLVEILALFMGWDWTFDHIIGQICVYLGLHLTEGFSAAIIVLLGQLGRLGVDVSGYEDSRVKKLRQRLSAFVLEITFMKQSFSAQFATITSLLGLTHIKFEEIVEGKIETSAVVNQSIPASFIREWFSQLSNEQQSHLRLHHAASESNFSPQTCFNST